MGCRMKNHLLRRFSDALLNHQLGLKYQPVFCTTTGQIVILEALLDWPELINFEVTAEELFEELEKNKVLSKLYDRYAFEIALRDFTLLIAYSHYSGMMSVNLCAATLEGHDIEPFVTQILDTYPDVSSRRVIIEITERGKWQDCEKALCNLRGLQKLEFNIALDDFMTGFANFNSLLSSEVNYLKIGQPFAQQEKSVEHQAVTKGVLDLCTKVSKQVIVEGIETQAELDYFKGYGYNFFQGYFFSEPVSLGEVARYLRNAQSLRLQGNRPSAEI